MGTEFAMNYPRYLKGKKYITQATTNPEPIKHNSSQRKYFRRSSLVVFIISAKQAETIMAKTVSETK